MKQTSVCRYFRYVGQSVSSKHRDFDYTSLYEYGDIDGANCDYWALDCTIDQYNVAIYAEFHTPPRKEKNQILITKYFPKIQRYCRIRVKRRLLMNLINIVNN